MIAIHEEQAEEREAIAAVNRAAFGGDEEAKLVEDLRRQGSVLLSLTAAAHGVVIGHILFSRLRVETPSGEVRAAALAPMAVLPEWQRKGIGAALIKRGLEACAEKGIEAVFVAGHADYYPRFGFSAEAAAGFESPWAGPHTMALELTPGALAGKRGRLVYAAAFGALNENDQPAPPAADSSR